MPELIDAADRFRAALLAKQATATGRLVRAYGRIYRDIQADIDDLLEDLWDVDTGTYRKSVKLERLRALRKQIAAEIDKYAIYADAEMLDGAQDAISQAMSDSRNLTQLSLPEVMREAGIMGQWHHLPTDAVEQMLGFLGQDSPLHGALTQRLGPEVAERVTDAMTKGVTLGWNPRRTAALVNRQFGAGLTWSMTTVRTAQIWSYREATRYSYAANPRIVKGWIWHAQLDTRTCMSCIALHGTRHPVTEALEDHHNGRCAMIPETVTYRDLGYDVDTDPIGPQPGAGETWFREQPESVQRQMMGPGMLDAWQGGEFAFEKLTVSYEDAVYGRMLRQATLAELVQ